MHTAIEMGGNNVNNALASDPGAFWEPAWRGECMNTCPDGYAVVGIKTYPGEPGDTGCGQGSLMATPLCASLR